MGRLLNRVQSKRKANCSGFKLDWQVIDLVEKLQRERRLTGHVARKERHVLCSLLVLLYFFAATLFWRYCWCLLRHL